MIFAVAGNGSVIVDSDGAVSNVNNTFHKIRYVFHAIRGKNPDFQSC